MGCFLAKRLHPGKKSVEYVAGLHWRFATISRKPRQVRKEAAVSGSFHVPRGRLGTAACRGRNRNIVAARGAAFLFGRSDHVLRCAVSPLAAGEFCRSRGAGAYQPYTFSCGCIGADEPCLSLSGAARTGKTSTAKILARALNCAEGPTLTPCGVCESCRSISDGSSMDVFEIDAASNRGTMRSVICASR